MRRAGLVPRRFMNPAFASSNTPDGSRTAATTLRRSWSSAAIALMLYEGPVVRRPVHRTDKMALHVEETTMNKNRRTFLKSSVAAGTAVAASPLAMTDAKAAGKGARVGTPSMARGLPLLSVKQGGRYALAVR